MKKQFKTRTVYLSRKREGKTNYRKRFKLLVSKKFRLVYRKSLKNVIMQVIEFDTKGDRVLAAASSENIKKLGWPYSGKNAPAAYLTGYLIGKKALKKKIKSTILDIGIYTHKNKSRVYAAVKGAIDAGLEVAASQKALPDTDRISGKHIADYALKLKAENPEKYKKVFSGYCAKNVDVTKIKNTFDEIKKKIV